MDANFIATLISNNLFPIGMCLLLFIQMQKDNENHQEEVEKLTTAINNNSLIIERLANKLGMEGE